jgi:hypothetical protein
MLNNLSCNLFGVSICRRHRRIGLASILLNQRVALLGQFSEEPLAMSEDGTESHGKNFHEKTSLGTVKKIYGALSASEDETEGTDNHKRRSVGILLVIYCIHTMRQ